MEERQWVTPDNPLHGLAARLQEQNDRFEYKWTVQTARACSLHSGSTLVKCFKGNEGGRQNHFVFAAFGNGPDAEAELAVMEVRLIAGLRKNCDEDEADGEEGLGRDARQVNRAGIEWKLVYGKMTTCDPVRAQFRTNDYSDGPAQDQPGLLAPDSTAAACPVHSLPSMVIPKPARNQPGGDGNYDYVVLMRDIQATSLVAELDGQRVFLPYRPMSAHA